MKHDLAAVRALLATTLPGAEFDSFCLKHFPSTFENFSSRATLVEKALVLVQDADRRGELEKLLYLLREINPRAYDEILPRLSAPTATQGAEVTEDRCDILILGTGPRANGLSELQRDSDLIRRELESTNSDKKLLLREEWVDRVMDLSKTLLRYQPAIVHFHGHGVAPPGLILEDDFGQVRPPSARALANMFAAVRGRTECVVLDACYSPEWAESLASQVRCVVGIPEHLSKEAAQQFAITFYTGLLSGRDYRAAFDLGRSNPALSETANLSELHFITRDIQILDPEASPPQVARTYRKSLSTAAGPEGALLYPLWYGTNRKPIEPGDLARGFSSERDHRVHYGTCRVAVPKSHKIGGTGSPWWSRLLSWTDDRLRLDRSGSDR
jgi:hypothetical protein